MFYATLHFIISFYIIINMVEHPTIMWIAASIKMQLASFLIIL